MYCQSISQAGRFPAKSAVQRSAGTVPLAEIVAQCCSEISQHTANGGRETLGIKGFALLDLL